MSWLRLSWLVMTVLLCASVPLACQKDSAKSAAKKAYMEGATLHEAAKIAGGHFQTNTAYNAGWVDYNLPGLKEESQAIVIGVAMDNVCRLSKDETSAETVYQFRVERVLKGSQRTGDTVTVVLPGGRVSFDDGMVAQENVPSYPRMVNGHRYVLFLMNGAGVGGKEYAPTGGPKGIVELLENGTVRSFAKTELDDMAKYNGTTEANFLEAVENAKFTKPAE